MQRSPGAAVWALLLLAAAAACPTAAAQRVSAASIAVNAAGLPLLTPSSFNAHGRSVYFEIPVAPVRGTLAFFHGCNHNASDGWPRASCPECTGLPEEVAHTKQALARGYAVIAIDPADPSGCFGVHTDRTAVVGNLQAWLAEKDLQAKPLYAAGVSAGAAFALKLPMAIRVHGVISEVLGVLPDSWDMASLGAAYPPTAFVSMPKDAKTAGRIVANTQTLRGYGVPTDVLEVFPQPVTADFLSNRSELITPELAAQVVEALGQMGLLDGSSMLPQDPRSTRLPWRALLADAVPEVAATQDMMRHIGEELNLAYGAHEITADAFTACLGWLEARGTLPLAGLAEQFSAVSLPGPRLRDLTPRRLQMMAMRARTPGEQASGGSGGSGSSSGSVAPSAAMFSAVAVF